ncbi:PQQ-binding-like beta-propeller repeat protein [Opitutales bacterium]|nr:PQQ-binding-like beta-propeller repeat protein [Opitutales bacterium]
MSFNFHLPCHTRVVIPVLMAMALAYTGVANPTAHWSTPYSTGGTIFSSPAIASDGTIYIGSNDNKLHAINSNGSAKWTFTTGDWVDSTPAIGADGTVYFGSWDNQLYAVNPTDGSKIWDFNTSSSIIASPAIGVDGRIYFGSKDEFFYALESNGSLAWETYVGNAITSSAAIGQDGTIYFGDENGTFHALNQDGTTKWTYEVDDVTDTNKSILSSPAIDLLGNLYFGSGNGYCYSITDGVSAAVLNWKVGTNDRVDASPVLGQNNEVFFVSRDGYLRSVDTGTGITNWEGFTGDVFYSSPVVDANGRVYVIGYTGFGENHLFAFNNDGSKEWDTNNSSSPLTIGGLVDSSLALDSNGNLFFGCFDHQVYSINVGSGIADNAWPQFQRNGLRTGAWPSYSVNVTISPTGAGVVNGTGIFNEGATATLSVTPRSSDGYSFIHWTGGQTGSNNPLVIIVNSDLNLTANFGLNTYNLSMNGTSGGTVSSGGIFTHGDIAQITATPGNGYFFNGWTGEAVSDPASSSTTVSMTQARTITANFSRIPYELNVSIVPVGAGIIEGNGIHFHGDNVTLEVSPNTDAGYSFASWGGSMVSGANPLSFQISSDMNLTANFSLNEYFLSVTAEKGGSTSESVRVTHGTLAPINATPANGYVFSGWNGNGITDPSSSYTTVSMTQDRNVSAMFSRIQYYISSTAGIGGSVNDINGSYSYDSNLSITATPSTGYTFSNWTQSKNGILNTTLPSTILNVDNNQSIHANFTPINYELNVTASTGGSVSTFPTGINQPYDSLVSITARPDNGFYFTGWVGDNIGDLNSTSTTIRILEDHSIQANFAEIPINKFLLQLYSSPAFAANLLSGAGTYDENKSVVMSAVPNPGYSFVNWSGNTVSDENATSTTVIVSQDLNLTANFVLNQHTLQLSAGFGGSVSEGNSSYDYGSVVPILATPEVGFNFLKWEGNGSIENQFSASTNATINQDSNITAKFEKITCNISVTIVGKGLVDGTGIYKYEDNCTLSASPLMGYYFNKWSGSGIAESNNSILQINPTQDLNITAEFLPNSHWIQVSAGYGGSVTELNSSQTYGSVITLLANPSIGYSFMGWNGNVTYADQFTASTNATVIGDANITASFAPIKYSITINTSGSGITEGSGTYSYGDNATISAQAAEGYYFDKWNGDGIHTSTSEILKIWIDQDFTLTAHFIKSPTKLNESLSVFQFSQNWYVNDWFGYFFQSSNGWCYHYNLGWIYPESEADVSLWVWSSQLKWLWIDSVSYSKYYAWSAKDNDWLYFDFLTETGPKIYHFKNETWNDFDKNKVASTTDSLF